MLRPTRSTAGAFGTRRKFETRPAARTGERVSGCLPPSRKRRSRGGARPRHESRRRTASDRHTARAGDATTVGPVQEGRRSRAGSVRAAWFVFYGVGSRQFVAIGTWWSAEPVRVEARTAEELRELMHEAENGSAASSGWPREWVA